MKEAWQLQSRSEVKHNCGKRIWGCKQGWVILVTVWSLSLCAVDIWTSPCSELAPCGLIFCMRKSDTEKFSLHLASHVAITSVRKLVVFPLHQ